MWISFNDAFISCVEDRGNADQLVVRARRRDALQRLFPDREVRVDGGADYRYRVFVSKSEFASVVVQRIMGINYWNFKGSVTSPDLYQLYESFWFLHRKYQL